jgi:NADPH-dependent 2,4-dienoyl-CoA reductase/sulfur reductase-like enzyme
MAALRQRRAVPMPVAALRQRRAVPMPVAMLLAAGAVVVPAAALQLQPLHGSPHTAAWARAAVGGAAGSAQGGIRPRCRAPTCVYSMRRDQGNTGGTVRVSRGRRVLAGRLSTCDCPPDVSNASHINVAVLGGGSFGTAMSHVLGRKGVNVTLIVRKPEVAASINQNGTNTQHQSHVQLPPTVHATVDAASAFADADFIFHAVPVQFTREVLGKVAHLMPPGVPIISLSKGIETSTLMLMAEV